MPEWLDRALFGVLIALAASFFWGCIAGVMGAFSILIWIGGIAAIVGMYTGMVLGAEPTRNVLALCRPSPIT
jgi:hypothetical protein